MLRLTLAQARAQIDLAMHATLVWCLRGLLALSGVVGAALLLQGAHADPILSRRLWMCLAFATASAIGLVIARRHGARPTAGYMAAAILVLSGINAYLTSTGVMSATMALLPMMIVVSGFVIGPQAGKRFGVGAVALVGVLWATQSAGWITGVRPGNVPPLMTHGLILFATLAIITVTVSHYGELFWGLMQQLDDDRRELAHKVTQQDAVHGQLQEGQQRLTTLLEHAPICIFVLDKDTGEVSFANRQALLSHGVANVGQLISVCLFDEAPYQRDALMTLVHRVRDSGTVSQRWRSRTQGGRTLWWSVRMELLTLSDEPQVVMFAQDITENLEQQEALLAHRQELAQEVAQRTAELVTQQRRLESVIEALPMALTIKDRDGRFVLSNRRFEEGFGLTKAMLIGNSPEELFPPALAERLRAHEDTLLASPQMVRFENSLMTREGNSRDQLVTKVPLLDAQQQPEAVLTVAVDITEQKALQRELSAAKTEAERLSQVKTEFLANMSHEIRTPLHGMLGMAQVAQACVALPREASEAIGRILRSGRHLMGVIDDILDFSRLDAGKLSVEEAPYSPADLAREVIELVHSAAQDKGLQLLLRCEPTPPLVMGDPMRTRQILLNTVANAIKFTQSGRVTLHLRSEASALVFDVTDTGIGMSSEAQQRVFSPFEQADGSTSRRFGGTGLGLSISRHLARLQGGDISVYSVEGQGSTFTVTLPLTEPIPAQLVPTTSVPDAPHADIQGLRVLAADDVDINREILVSLLGKRGAQVTLAEDGQQALALVQQHGPGHFDIALMDVQMPVMDGVEATRLMRQIDPDLPVLALTAHALPEERERCLAAGMRGHLAKPFDAQDMVMHMHRLARRHGVGPAAEPVSQLAQVPRHGVTLPPLATTPLPHPPELAGPTLQLDQALTRCGGQDALLRKLVKRFVEQQADFARRTPQSTGADTEALGRAVHQFKGTTANLGLPELSALAAQLEAALRTQPPSAPGELQAMWQALDAQLHHHVAALQHWLGEPVTA